MLKELSEKVASLKSDFGGLREHVHIEYPCQSDSITDLGRDFAKLNAKFGSDRDVAVGPLRHIETLIPKFTDYDIKLEAIEALLSNTILEWSDARHENAGNYELDRQLPECKVWRSLLQSFDDLEDNITNELHELKEHINTKAKQPDTKLQDNCNVGSSPLSAQSSVLALARRGRTASRYTSPNLAVAALTRSTSNT